MIISGKVITGTGQGKYFMSQQQYKEQFKEKLGFIPFEGTLNIKVEKIPKLDNPITIQGFTSDKQTFGNVNCFAGKIKNIDVTVIFPEKTRHPPDIVEIIADKNLRNLLGLKDGDEIEVLI